VRAEQTKLSDTRTELGDIKQSLARLEYKVNEL